MFKNVASQKLIVFAFDATTNLPKTGDSANITAYVSKDYGAVTVLGDTSATEMDSTNAKGYYLFDLTQSETNGDVLLFSAKSSTANISVIGVPATVYTTPANFTSASIDSNGRVDVIKIAGTTQTARDIGASVLISSGTGTGQLSVTSGVIDANTTKVSGTAQTARDLGASVLLSSGTGAGQVSLTSGKVDVNDKTGFSLSSAGVQAIWDALTSALTTVGSIGKRLADNIDAAISSRSTYAGGDTSGTTTLLSRLTSTRAGLLDNLDVAVSTRLDSASYTAPDNTSITAIKDKTNNLPASPAATSDIPTATQNADALLNRDMSAVTVTNSRSPINALRAIRNKTAVSSGSLTVYKEDDSTSAWTATVSSDASAEPITGIDPA